MHFFSAGIDSGKGFLVNEQGCFLCQGHSRKKEKKKRQEKNILILFVQQLFNPYPKFPLFIVSRSVYCIELFDKQESALIVLIMR